MGIKPLGKRVLLKPKEKEEKTKGGILIPDEAKEDRKEGIVESKGSEVEDLKEGDHVIYGGYSDEEIEYQGEKYIIIKAEDIIAKIE